MENEIKVAALFILGACIGSFVNVLIDRLPQGRSLVRPPSHCEGCKTRLKWFELFPILSWVFLLGRCRTCRTRVTPRIPLVELLLGLTALYCAWHFQAFASTAGVLLATQAFLLTAICLAIMAVDFKWWLIPHPLWIALLLNGLLFQAFIDPSGLTSLLLGAGLGLVLFTCLLLLSTWVMRKKSRISADETAMGWGDVWLIAAIGANLGAQLIFITLVLACIQAVLTWVALSLWQNQRGVATRKLPEGVPANSVPLGTFLGLATIELALFKPYLFDFMRPFLDLGL